MAQPKEPPLSIRPGAQRLHLIDAFAKDNGLTRHAAVLVLIDRSLVAEQPARAGRVAERQTPARQLPGGGGYEPPKGPAQKPRTGGSGIQVGPRTYKPGELLDKKLKR